MIRLIAADMDGTLLDSEKRMPSDFVNCVKELAERGILFCVSSGRQYHKLLADLEDVAEDIAIIAENGAVIYDRGNRLCVESLDPELVREPIEAVRHMQRLGVVVCGAESAYVENDNPEFLRNVNQYYERNKLVSDALLAAEDDLICKLAFFDLEQAETNSYPKLVRFSDRFIVCLSGEHWVDFMKPGINKGTALKTLQNVLGISREETMAFGDYMNDIEMMEACEHSYAMANGHPDLKKICRYEAKSNDENGVIDTIRSVVLDAPR